MKNFFVSIPHSGEEVPTEASWLKSLREEVLMCDVDRFVDRIYLPSLQELNIPCIIAKWHRYAVDLNRFPSDIDKNSVEMPLDLVDSKKHAFQSLGHPRGFHWSVTTKRHKLLKAPMSFETHQKLVKKCFLPYHEALSKKMKELQKKNESKKKNKILLLDAHSMPSLGTEAHRDPGHLRAEIVVSDREGKSAEKNFTHLVIEAYKNAGFEVVLNWPYQGGRIIETYGKPKEGQNAIQVELNRNLYMDEKTRRLRSQETLRDIQGKIKKALHWICEKL